jgi:AcrR family transcriptional regulator
VPTPRRLPKGQGHLLRDEILRATVELLDETNDADAVSTRAIATRVQRSTPLIYEHFEDRTTLLRTAARAALEDMARQLEVDVSDEQDIATRLRTRAHRYVAFAISHPEAYRVLFMDHRVPATESLEGFIATTGLSGVERDLTMAQQAGLLAATDVRTVTVTLWAAIHGVASLLLTHPDMDWPDQLLDHLLDQLRDGLDPRPQTPPPSPARRRSSTSARAR